MTNDTAAPEPRRAGPGRYWRLQKNLVLFVGVPLAWAIVILAFYWLMTSYEPISMPGQSMLPTLEPGDYVMTREDYFQSARPGRGDLVIHRVPDQGPRMLYVKRVVGLPGDEIRMVGGVLQINGAPVGRTPSGTYELTGLDGSPRNVPQYVETLPGGSAYRIVEERGDTGRQDNTRAYTVPPDHYFVLGDNRDNSADSRTYGPVPAEFIRHRPLFIFWSKDRGRIGMRVR